MRGKTEGYTNFFIRGGSVMARGVEQYALSCTRDCTYTSQKESELLVTQRSVLRPLVLV
jgi:hypothetical protein